jgi:ABC-2 type transport system ATP-binding protein
VRFLSGGEKRRVHTAMALLHDPPLLLLDEPTVGADVVTRAALVELVRSYAADGRAILYSTHYLGEVEALGGTVVIIAGGRVIARGRVDELVAQHTVPAVELRFAGPPPPELCAGALSVDGDAVRIAAERPAAVMQELLRGLDADSAGRLAAIEVVRPSLEAVFVALTGTAGTAGGTGDAAAETTDGATTERRDVVPA